MTDSVDLWNGHLCTLDIDERPWLLAGRMTNIESGRSWRFTYSSPILQSGDPMFQRMIEWVDGALPLGDMETAEDPDMMFGSGELRLYELRPLDVTA